MSGANKLALEEPPVLYVSGCACERFLLGSSISQRFFEDGFEVLRHLVDHLELELGSEIQRRQMFAYVFLPIHKNFGFGFRVWGSGFLGLRLTDN